ncbi:hypothetical protein EDB81DRAFT_370282 [Dactylonectria macrodidyma]|uniref:Uncharacterized protein n=1 Tax=Dactylonectria macrodidyma TaxID=307937 RepID=A0A9P9D188_9HYPO|nr:hypothetical protein EDB81DRAFT_370282 [Dactylonectria macrodidyma]
MHILNMESLTGFNLTVLRRSENETISAGEDTAGSGQHFTRWNVIGLFLTLQLCQLTQPYGSLLFRGASGFFWRCNPIASVAESLIILWYLAAAVLRSWKEGRDARTLIFQQLRQSSERGDAARRCWKEGTAAVLEQLHLTASGLLLVRGTLRQDDVGGLMQRLMAGSFNDGETHHPRAAPDVNSTATPSVPNPEQYTDTSAHARPQPVSRQPTLEANRQPFYSPDSQFPGFGRRSEKSRLLREAFGANAVAHGELRIDIFTICTELFVLVKLVTVTGNGWLTAGGLCMVLGWAAVQALLVLTHLRAMDELDMAAALRITRATDAELKEHADWWMGMYMALHLSLFGYAAYLGACRPWISKDAVGFPGFLRATYDFLECSFCFTFAYFSIPVGVGALFRGVRDLRWTLKLPFVLVIMPLWFWMVAAPVSHVNQLSIENASGPTLFFEPYTVMYYIVDMGFSYFLVSIWFLVLLVAMALAYFFTFFSSSKSESLDRKRVSAGNIVFTVVILVVFVRAYDETTTSKPRWTEILG